MIAAPRLLADEGCPLVDAPAVEVDGLDLVRGNVVAGGGREQTFLRALAAGTAQDSDPSGALDIVALAAWRAGVLGIRDDALARLGSLLGTNRAGVAAAALGIPVQGLAEFAAQQASDRFWWPGRAGARGYVLAVGGFSGLGGTWVRPPSEWMAIDRPGAFAVRVAEEWWRVDADVWGAHLRRIDEAPVSVPAGGTTIVIGEDTHLAWLHVQDAA